MSTKLGKIEFDKIEVGVYKNPRTDMGDVAALAEDIKRNSLLQPLLVQHKEYGGDGYKTPDGKKVFSRYILVAGHRRHAAILRIREEDKKAFEEVPVVLLKGNDDDALFAQIAENVARKDLNPVELADALHEMVGRGHDIKVVAERTGITAQWAGRLLKIREACCHEVLKGIVKGEISAAAAYDFVGLDEDKQKAALNNYKETKATKGSKAAKRGAAKDGDKPMAPGKRLLGQMFKLVSPWNEEKKSDYWRGVCDALAYATGESETVAIAVEKEAEKRGIDLDAKPKKAPKKEKAPKAKKEPKPKKEKAPKKEKPAKKAAAKKPAKKAAAKKAAKKAPKKVEEAPVDIDEEPVEATGNEEMEEADEGDAGTPEE